MVAFLACVRGADEGTAALEAGFDGVVGPDLGAVPSGAIAGRFETDGGGGPVLVLDHAENRRSFGIVTDGCPAEGDVERLAAGHAGLCVTSRARVVETVTVAGLTRWAMLCRARALSLAVGGGVEIPDIPRLLAIAPDLLLLGGALRAGDAFDPDRARAVLALRPQAPAAAVVGMGGPRDRIFVRDLVLPVAIGVYASEIGRTQRVRFSIEAELDALDGVARAMGDVVSYDLLADAAQRLATGRHIDFVETLAEEIAAALLVVPRIAVIRVRIEKLDLGPAVVGVEIERRRPALA